MAQGIFGNNVLGIQPHGVLAGLGELAEGCVFSPYTRSRIAQQIQQEMVSKGVTNLSTDGLWGGCSQDAYHTFYGEPLSKASLTSRGITCGQFLQWDDNGTQGKFPVKCPSYANMPPPVVAPEPVTTCGPGEKLGPGNLCVPLCDGGFHFDPSTAQCMIDQLVCPAGQKPDSYGKLCIPECGPGYKTGNDNLCIPVCGAGTHFDLATALCVIDKITCPEGQTPDPANGQVCIPVPRQTPSYIKTKIDAAPVTPSSKPSVNTGLLKNLSVPNMASLFATPAAAPEPSSYKVSNIGISKMPLFAIPSQPSESKSEGGLFNNRFNLKLPGLSQKGESVTAPTIEEPGGTWINGVPNWLVVLFAVTAVGGGYYVYQKKQKGPRSAGK